MGYLEQDELPFVEDSKTSRAAAESMLPAADTKRGRVLAFITSRGWGGATDEEIIDHFGGPGVANGIRPRRVELEHAGLVRDSGSVRRTRSGRFAAVWVRTDPVLTGGDCGR